MCAVCSQLAPAPTRAVCTGQRPGQGLFFRLVSQSARLHARTGMRPHRMSGKSRRTAQRTDGERERERASTVEHRKSRRRPDALCNRRAASATSGPRHESCKTRGVRGGVHGRHLRLSRAGGRLPAASPSFSHLLSVGLVQETCCPYWTSRDESPRITQIAQGWLTQAGEGKGEDEGGLGGRRVGVRGFIESERSERGGR